MQRLYLKEKDGKRRGGFWIMYFFVLKTPPLSWMLVHRKRAVSASPKPWRSLRRWRIGSWVGWLAVSNWIPFVEIKAGRTQLTHHTGNCWGTVMVSYIWADSVPRLWNGSCEMDPEHYRTDMGPETHPCEKEDYLQALKDFPNFSLWVLC